MDYASQTSYHVIRNEHGRMSLWRSDISSPDGWRIVSSGMSHQRATAYVDAMWDHGAIPLRLSLDD